MVACWLPRFPVASYCRVTPGHGLKVVPSRCCCALSRGSYPYQGGEVVHRSICDRKGLWFIGDFIGGRRRTEDRAGRRGNVAAPRLSWQAGIIFEAGSLHGGVLASVVLGGELLQGNAETWLKVVPSRCCCGLSRGSYPYQRGQVLQRSICDRKGICFIGDIISVSSRDHDTVAGQHIAPWTHR